MFSRVFALFSVALIASVGAVPTTYGGGHGHGTEVTQCNGGTIQCCNKFEQQTGHGGGLLGLGLGLGSLPLIGSDCSQLNLLGIGSNSCSSQPVCCTGNQFNGLVALGCTPININL